jgi:hypothetical protein
VPAEELPAGLDLVIEGRAPGSRGAILPCRREGDRLVFTVDEASSGRWLYGVPRG